MAPYIVREIHPKNNKKAMRHACLFRITQTTKRSHLKYPKLGSRVTICTSVKSRKHESKSSKAWFLNNRKYHDSNYKVDLKNKQMCTPQVSNSFKKGKETAQCTSWNPLPNWRSYGGYKEDAINSELIIRVFVLQASRKNTAIGQAV